MSNPGGFIDYDQKAIDDAKALSYKKIEDLRGGSRFRDQNVLNFETELPSDAPDYVKKLVYKIRDEEDWTSFKNVRMPFEDKLKGMLYIIDTARSTGKKLPETDWQSWIIWFQRMTPDQARLAKKMLEGHRSQSKVKLKRKATTTKRQVTKPDGTETRELVEEYEETSTFKFDTFLTDDMARMPVFTPIDRGKGLSDERYVDEIQFSWGTLKIDGYLITYSDETVLLALLKHVMELDYNVVCVSLYQLCEDMKVSKSTKSYNQIWRSIEHLQKTSLQWFKFKPDDTTVKHRYMSDTMASIISHVDVLSRHDGRLMITMDELFLRELRAGRVSLYSTEMRRQIGEVAWRILAFVSSHQLFYKGSEGRRGYRIGMNKLIKVVRIKDQERYKARQTIKNALLKIEEKGFADIELTKNDAYEFVRGSKYPEPKSLPYAKGV